MFLFPGLWNKLRPKDCLLSLLSSVTLLNQLCIGLQINPMKTNGGDSKKAILMQTYTYIHISGKEIFFPFFKSQRSVWDQIWWLISVQVWGGGVGETRARKHCPKWAVFQRETDVKTLSISPAAKTLLAVSFPRLLLGRSMLCRRSLSGGGQGFHLKKKKDERNKGEGRELAP